MAERRVPKIVRQRDRFGEIFIECQRPRDCPADRCDFNRMCQPGSEMVAGAVQKNLCLVFEPPKCARMNDPRAVALKLGPKGVAWLRIFSAARVARFLRERRERSAFGRFHLLTRFPGVLHLAINLLMSILSLPIFHARHAPLAALAVGAEADRKAPAATR